MGFVVGSSQLLTVLATPSVALISKRIVVWMIYWRYSGGDIPEALLIWLICSYSSLSKLGFNSGGGILRDLGRGGSVTVF